MYIILYNKLNLSNKINCMSIDIDSIQFTIKLHKQFYVITKDNFIIYELDCNNNNKLYKITFDLLEKPSIYGFNNYTIQELELEILEKELNNIIDIIHIIYEKQILEYDKKNDTYDRYLIHLNIIRKSIPHIFNFKILFQKYINHPHINNNFGNLINRIIKK